MLNFFCKILQHAKIILDPPLVTDRGWEDEKKRIKEMLIREIENINAGLVSIR